MRNPLTSTAMLCIAAGNFPEPSKCPNEIVRFENAAHMPNLEELIRDRDRLIQKVLPEIIWAQGS